MADTFLQSVESGANGGPRFSQEGLDLVRTFEGFRPDAYYDLGGKRGTLTVGYGFTNSDIPDLKPGYRIDQRRAEQMLPGLLNKKYGPTVLQNVKVPLTDQQYSALTSFAYNVGPGNFKNSTLLKKLNAGDFEGAATEFDRWIYAGGKPMEGLVRRRAAERELFRGNTDKVGALLEQQRFNLTRPPSLSENTQDKGNSFLDSLMKGDVKREDLEQKLPAKPGMLAGVKREDIEQKLPASTDVEVEKQNMLQNLTTANKSVPKTDAEWDAWRKDFDQRIANLKEETSKLPEPPPIDGSADTRSIAASPPPDPWANVATTVPETGDRKLGPEDSTVNAIRKIMGKEPINLSNLGSNVKVDFKFGVGDVLAGLGKNIKDSLVNSFSQGGAWSPMPDNPEDVEEEPSYEPPQMVMPSFGGAGYTTAQQLNEYTGLRPARRA